MPEALRRMVQTAVVEGVGGIFWTVTVVAGLCLLLCLVHAGRRRKVRQAIEAHKPFGRRSWPRGRKEIGPHG
jgi:hypothetical protein